MSLNIGRLAFLLGLAALLFYLLIFQSSETPAATPAAVSSAISSLSISPNPLPANTPVILKISARINARSTGPIDVELYRRTNKGDITLFTGPLSSDKSTATLYSATTTVNLPPGHILLQLRTFPQTKIITSPLQTVISLSPPAGYTVDSKLLALGGPLSFDNFNHSYISGGFIPIGGADISVFSAPVSQDFMTSEIAKEFPGIDFNSTATTTTDGAPCTQVSYPDPNSAEVTFCLSGGLLYRFSLQYSDSDPAQKAQFISTYEGVINAANLLP